MTETINPYSAPDAILVDAVQPTELKMASRGTRLGAYLIDFLIALAIALPFLIAFWSRIDWRDPNSLRPLGWLTAPAGWLAYLAIHGRFLYLYGQTVGKRLLKIRIVRANGDRVGFGRLIGMRVFLLAAIGMIPCVGPLVSLVDPLMIFRDDKRCLHDLIADTKVIEVGNTLAIGDAIAAAEQPAAPGEAGS